MTTQSKLTVKVDRMRIFANHGVFDMERSVGNEFEVTVMVDYPVTDAALTHDSLQGTLNYVRLISIIKHEMGIPARLLEHVAARMITTIRREFAQAETVVVEIVKLMPPIAGISVSGVSIRLTSEPPGLH